MSSRSIFSVRKILLHAYSRRTTVYASYSNPDRPALYQGTEVAHVYAFQLAPLVAELNIGLSTFPFICHWLQLLYWRPRCGEASMYAKREPQRLRKHRNSFTPMPRKLLIGHATDGLRTPSVCFDCLHRAACIDIRSASRSAFRSA